VLHCGSTGKIFLANLTVEEVDAILDRVGTPQFTPYTITDRSKLRQELQHIRECGYALDREEVALGRACIAVPIEVRQVQLGALSLRITPPERLQVEFIRHSVAVMRKTAASIANGVSQTPELPPDGDGRRDDPARGYAPKMAALSRVTK
jgi:DNA-binding IclR family transcriptional regulator